MSQLDIVIWAKIITALIEPVFYLFATIAAIKYLSK